MRADVGANSNDQANGEKTAEKQNTGDEGTGIGTTVSFVQPVDGWPEGETETRTDTTTEPQMFHRVIYGIMSKTQANTPCSESNSKHPDTTPHTKGHGARMRAGHVSQRALRLDAHHHEVVSN